MNVELISIGDELLIGQTVNTNAAYLGRRLTALGLEVRWVTTVGDRADDLKRALRTAVARSEVTIATGGLGPTHDDITKEVAAEFFESDFIVRPEILERIEKAFAKRGMTMPAVNEGQARVPRKAQLIDNPVGTAPGLIFEKDGRKCFILPGVPAEMKAMCDATVFPMLRGPGRPIAQKTVRTFGLAESTLFERVGSIEALQKIVSVAFLPRTAGVDIRLTAKGKELQACRARVEQAVAYLQDRLGEYVYGYDEQEMEHVVAELLFGSGETVAVAESCTGGLLAHKLTNISGSSEYFERGVVAYSNRAKREVLGVPEATLQTHGAVSAETAVAMAEGVRKISAAHYGLSTTGIAGPTGGSKEKPVGLVYVGFAAGDRSYSERFIFTRDRLFNKERSAQAALNLLRKELLRRRTARE